MGELKIQFDSIRDIEQFVRITAKLDGTVRVVDGEQIMDGKAIMGLLSLGLRRPLALTYEGSEAEREAFVRSIQAYLI